MKKLKKFWSKLKYWQKGAIIGFVFGLIAIYSVDMPSFLSIFFVALPYLFLITLFWILNILPDDPLGPEGIAAIAILLSPLFYALLGALIGVIISKIKKK